MTVALVVVVVVEVAVAAEAGAVDTAVEEVAVVVEAAGAVEVGKGLAQICSLVSCVPVISLM